MGVKTPRPPGDCSGSTPPPDATRVVSRKREPHGPRAATDAPFLLVVLPPPLDRVHMPCWALHSREGRGARLARFQALGLTARTCRCCQLHQPSPPSLPTMRGRTHPSMAERIEQRTIICRCATRCLSLRACACKRLESPKRLPDEAHRQCQAHAAKRAPHVGVGRPGCCDPWPAATLRIDILRRAGFADPVGADGRKQGGRKKEASECWFRTSAASLSQWR